MFHDEVSPNDSDPLLADDELCTRTNACFRIISDSRDPKTITDALGISPTKAWARGDDFVCKWDGLRHEQWNGHWSVSTEGKSTSTSMEAHARLLLEIIQPAAAAIQTIMLDPNLSVAIVFWWEAKYGHGNFSLRRETVRDLSSLCQMITFHVITSEPE